MQKSRVRSLRAERLIAERRLEQTIWAVCCKYPEVIEFLEAQKHCDMTTRLYSSAWCELTQAQREELIPEFFIDTVQHLPKEIKMTRRDMTRKEFDAALERRGFELIMGETGVKISETCTVGVFMVDRRNAYVLHHRETLKRAIEIAGRNQKGQS